MIPNINVLGLFRKVLILSASSAPIKAVITPVRFIVDKTYDASQVLHWASELIGTNQLLRSIFMYGLDNDELRDRARILLATFGSNSGSDLIELQRNLALSLLDVLEARTPEDKALAQIEFEAASNEFKEFLRIPALYKPFSSSAACEN